jgi:hypothetical protein
MRLTHLGLLPLGENDARDSYPATARSQLVDLRNGAYDYDGSAVVWDATTVSRTYFISGERMDEQQDTLKVMLAAGRCIGIFELRDGRQRCTYLKIQQVTPQVTTAQWKYRQPLSINLSRAYPFYWDFDHCQFFDLGLELDSGLSFDDHYDEINLNNGATTFSIAYNGSVDTTMLCFTFVPAAASTLADILVENLTSGESFLFEGTVAASTRLDVDCATKTVMNDSVDAFDDLSFPDDKQCEVMHLAAPAGNNFRVTATLTGASAKLYVSWVGTFL